MPNHSSPFQKYNFNWKLQNFEKAVLDKSSWMSEKIKIIGRFWIFIFFIFKFKNLKKKKFLFFFIF